MAVGVRSASTASVPSPPQPAGARQTPVSGAAAMTSDARPYPADTHPPKSRGSATRYGVMALPADTVDSATASTAMTSSRDEAAMRAGGRAAAGSGVASSSDSEPRVQSIRTARLMMDAVMFVP